MNYPEIKELFPTEAIWPANISEEEKLQYLERMRSELCSQTADSFTLQRHQRFLRRILSPDSPTRNLLMVHGTGVGKTCTAIQVAEEYILRPEYQDKKVMIIASRAVEENFRKEIFDIQRVEINETAKTFASQQCTGRRYLDMLLRIENEPKNWKNPDIRDRLETIADKIIGEFYEFMAYISFGNLITGNNIDDKWIHENFDNRLLIIDEAHNIREGGSKEVKAISEGLRKLVNVATNLTLICLTATPMYDVYDEIMFYYNLFMWNDRRQEKEVERTIEEFFTKDATLKGDKAGETFRKWCSEYVSYVKGENPFTFPFRLPPLTLASKNAITTSFRGDSITSTQQMKYLDVVESTAQGEQLKVLSKVKGVDEESTKLANLEPTVAVFPEGKTFNELFKWTGKAYQYIGTPFLTPEELPKYAAKFVNVIKTIEAGTGVCFVYSNFLEMGARLFAMALEEHGYTPAVGTSMLASNSYEGNKKGSYILLTSDTSNAKINTMLNKVRNKNNRDGSQVRVIISSPVVSEGVSFKYVRQVHVLDPWWNMSRIEQVIGRGLRYCSHELLPFKEQNCTVYLHVVRTGTGRECFDEYTYRTRIEPKAIKIARVKRVIMESAMDCAMQSSFNNMPDDWKRLPIPQQPSVPPNTQDRLVKYPLFSMLAPTFTEDTGPTQCLVMQKPGDPEHVRPLSTYLDVRDEILTRIGKLFQFKAIWKRDELLKSLRPYQEDVIIYNIQHAITTGFRFEDSFGRPSLLESKGNLYALAPIGIVNATMVERTTKAPVKGKVAIPGDEEEEEKEEEQEEETPTVDASILDERREAYTFPADAKTRFSKDILNSFIFDHELTLEEKRGLIRGGFRAIPFLERNHVPGTDYYVLGEGVTEPAEPPVGTDKTAYDAWNKALVEGFIANKEKLFASMTSTNKFTVSKMTVDGQDMKRKIEKKGKLFNPVICGTGENDKKTMDAFAKFVDSRGVGVPKVQKNAKQAPKDITGSDFCVYIELLAREEHNCIWYTPEQLSVLYDNQENKRKFTEAFRK